VTVVRAAGVLTRQWLGLWVRAVTKGRGRHSRHNRHNRYNLTLPPSTIHTTRTTRHPTIVTTPATYTHTYMSQRLYGL